MGHGGLTMDEILKTINNYIRNVGKKKENVGYTCSWELRVELDAEIDRLTKLKKLVESKMEENV